MGFPALFCLSGAVQASSGQQVEVDAHLLRAAHGEQCPLAAVFEDAVAAPVVPEVFVERRRIVVRSGDSAWVIDDRRRSDRASLAQTLFAPCRREADGVSGVRLSYHGYEDLPVEERATLVRASLADLHAQHKEAAAKYAKDRDACRTPVEKGPAAPPPGGQGESGSVIQEVLSEGHALRKSLLLADRRREACRSAGDLSAMFGLGSVSALAAEADAQRAKLADRTREAYERAFPAVMELLQQQIVDGLDAAMNYDAVEKSFDDLARLVRRGEGPPDVLLAYVDNSSNDLRKLLQTQLQELEIASKLSAKLDDVTGGWCATEGREVCQAAVAKLIEDVKEFLVVKLTKLFDNNANVRWVRANQSRALRTYFLSEHAGDGGDRFNRCMKVIGAAAPLADGVGSMADCNRVAMEATGVGCEQAVDRCKQEVERFAAGASGLAAASRATSSERNARFREEQGQVCARYCSNDQFVSSPGFLFTWYNKQNRPIECAPGYTQRAYECGDEGAMCQFSCRDKYGKVSSRKGKLSRSMQDVCPLQVTVDIDCD